MISNKYSLTESILSQFNMWKDIDTKDYL